MSKNSNKPNWAEISTLVVVICGGILGYFFVHRPQIETNRAVSKYNTEFVKVQTQIGRLEQEVKRIKDVLEIRGKQVENTIAIADFLTDLIPNIEITNITKVDPSEKSFHINFKIKNLGKYGCYIDRPEIVVTTEKIINQKEIRGQLVYSKDYGLINDLPIGFLISNNDTKYDQVISFQQENLPKKIFVMATFKFQTDKDLINIASILLGNFVQKELFERKSLGFYIISIDSDTLN